MADNQRFPFDSGVAKVGDFIVLRRGTGAPSDGYIVMRGGLSQTRPFATLDEALAYIKGRQDERALIESELDANEGIDPRIADRSNAVSRCRDCGKTMLESEQSIPEQCVYCGGKTRPING